MIPADSSPRLAGGLRPALRRTLPPIVGFVLWAMGACLVAGMARSQSSDVALQPGARIRVHDPELGKKWVVGRAVGWSGDTLAFRADRDPDYTRRMSVDDRTRIETSVGQHDRMLMGLLIGGGAGLLVGSVIYGVEETSSGMGEIGGAIAAGLVGVPPPRHEEVSTAPIYIGLVAGGVLGAVIGKSAKIDRWMPARLPGHLAFGMSSGGAAGVRLSLTVSR